MAIHFGDENQVLPGLGYQGQPTVFNTGSYPRVFKAVFNSNVFSAVAWSLDGRHNWRRRDAALRSRRHRAGERGWHRRRDVERGGRLQGTETTYSFEYGETIAYDQ